MEKQIKLTAIWRGGERKEYFVQDFECSIFNDTTKYYITLDDGYTFVCDAIEVVIL